MAVGSPAREHELNQRIARPVASQADLTATGPEQPPRGDGVVTLVSGDGSLWRFDAASTAAASSTVLVPDDAPATGRWHELVAAGGVTANLNNRIALHFANTAAQTAYPEASRVDGQIAIVDDDDKGVEADYTLWVFDAASAAGASDYVRVPDAGTGRWLRQVITPPELTAILVAALVASQITITDAGDYYLGGSVEVALQEVGAGDPGHPMQNRLRMLGAPGAIAAGDTVSIGSDVYEFNANTPPSGGTAGYIWVYQGADSAASRANFNNAVNGVIDAPNITYDGAVTEDMVASAGVTTGDVVVQSADAIGGNPAPSSTATAVAETLTTVTDVWDNATMRQGLVQGPRSSAMVSITLTAADIAKGNIQAYFAFTPSHCIVGNRNRPQDEAYTITGDAVSLTLAGGVSPNNQAGDVIDIIAFE